LPTETQEQLLRAALLDGDAALVAWRGWMSEPHPLEDENLAFQVLPLAYRNIHRLDPGAEGLDHAKGVYRYVWVKNQVLIRVGARAVESLHEAGIDVLVLKGAALTLLNYRDLGLRLMADIDLLVPRDSALSAISTMRGSLSPKQPALDSDERVLVEHGSSWVDDGGNEVDLHWYSLWQSSPDEDFWDAALPIEIDGVASLALAPSDQLLHVCAHGASWHSEPALRWVLDAVTVIRSGEIDWKRLVSQARRRELTITLADALGYLRSGFGVEIPEEVLIELRDSPTSLTSRIARRGLTHRPTMVSVIGTHWDRYRRIKRLDPGAPHPPSFAAHMRISWGYQSYGGLVKHGIRRALGVRPRARSWSSGHEDGVTSPDA
jgi:hypothetical protein